MEQGKCMKVSMVPTIQDVANAYGSLLSHQEKAKGTLKEWYLHN